MKRFKDLIYDYNDVFVAVMIVVLAGAIIFWRISDIMAYPEYLAQQIAGNATDDVDVGDLDLSLEEVDDMNENPEDITTDPADSEGETTPPIPEEEEEPVQTGEFTTSKEVSFTVPAGVTGSKIAQLLLEEKLIESTEAFMTEISEQNAETGLMAGTFKIPAGSTVGDIVDILTR